MKKYCENKSEKTAETTTETTTITTSTSTITTTIHMIILVHSNDVQPSKITVILWPKFLLKDFLVTKTSHQT